MEGYLGEIRLFAGNFAPRGWAFCNGNAMSIAEYSTLYAVIGDLYGGNGVTSFNLPNLSSRVAVGTGQGVGLADVPLGQAGGTEATTMTVNQMPAHNHIASATISMPAYDGTDSLGSPTDATLAGLSGAYSPEAPDTHLAAITGSVALSNTGQGMPFGIVQPVLSLNYIICVEGIFPSRD